MGNAFEERTHNTANTLVGVASGVEYNDAVVMAGKLHFRITAHLSLVEHTPGALRELGEALIEASAERDAMEANTADIHHG